MTYNVFGGTLNIAQLNSTLQHAARMCPGSRVQFIAYTMKMSWTRTIYIRSPAIVLLTCLHKRFAT